MDVIYFKTSRGKDAFSHNGYNYRQDKRSRDGERMFWRCMDPNCNVRYESHGIDGPPVARGPQEHTHTPCPEDGLHRLAITDMFDHRDWHIDGTCKVVPRLFHHMFTIHARVEKKLIPCVYALMQTVHAIVSSCFPDHQG